MVVNSNRVEHFDNHESMINIQIELPPSPPLEIHRVRLPPERTTFQKLKQRLSEIFFPDDPLYRFKNQTCLQKLLLGLQFLFPIFQWAPEYNFRLLRSDVISGLTIASLAIPQGISYAKLANLPPIVGLYSSFVPPLIYSLLGSSRHIGVGPVSIASLVMGSMLSETVSSSEDSILYLKLAFTATFFAGVFQASLGILRLGFVIDFLSKATLVGFMAGAAVIVALQQLKGLLGIVHFTDKMQIIPVLTSVFKQREECVHNIKMVMANHCDGNLLPGLPVDKRGILHKAHGIAFIGKLPEGINPPSANMLYFDGHYLGVAIKTGIVTGILSLTEGIAVGRTFAAMQNYQVDGNKEMMAIGLMNIAGSCTSCYVTSGSFSRSAVNYNAGAKTTVSNIVMAAAVLVTLLFLMPLFNYTPNVILGAIIITAVIGLIDYQAAYKLWKVDKLDFLACLCSFFGVLFISVALGLAIAVGVSVFKILLHVTRPNTMVLGKLPGTQIYHNLNQYKEATRVPSFLILAVESPIYFANATYLQERILRWIREEEDRIRANDESTLKCIILYMTAVTAIDTSGIDTICELRKMLERRSLQLVLANPVASVVEKLHHSKMLDSFGSRGLYLTVGEAVADISSLWKDQA
ncbi:sulfate transporter 3 1 [Quillaja saponaria]|uniref:Sulfate transporter 3 1 n=1 Tax=Quillaja saponaria TaxID=32244 RepID=A0AAD7LTV0_QUISA|nr:sulfate transporter 3 1 [Quillaja saponaria]